MAIEMSDDVVLIGAIQEFLDQFRCCAGYPDLVGMSQTEFDRRDATERGTLFETALGRYMEKRTHRRIRVVTGPGTLDFGLGLSTPSGIRHEVDLVLTNGATLYAFEAKHYFGTEVTKDLLAVFNQKTLDFYLELLRRGLPVSMKRLFVARTAQFNYKVREFAWSWGIGLLGGDQRNSVWLRHQLFRWLETRVPSQALAVNAALADELASYALRDLADLVVPFSAAQATIRLDRLLGSERCERLVQDHERLNNFWREQRAATTKMG
jgi:hypothetical protein